MINPRKAAIHVMPLRLKRLKERLEAERQDLHRQGVATNKAARLSELAGQIDALEHALKLYECVEFMTG